MGGFGDSILGLEAKIGPARAILDDSCGRLVCSPGDGGRIGCFVRYLEGQDSWGGTWTWVRVSYCVGHSDILRTIVSVSVNYADGAGEGAYVAWVRHGN